jgi:hypothetical protein
MKTRSGFVSNSSSTSYIVIGNKKRKYSFVNTHLESGGVLIVDNNLGQDEFAWGSEIINDMGSRIIFSYLIAQYNNNNDWIEMLENTILDNTMATKIEWVVSIEKDSYIDHQSHECSANTEMFKSKGTLASFIFDQDSKIILDSNG